jgi:hypothetical protein
MRLCLTFALCLTAPARAADPPTIRVADGGKAIEVLNLGADHLAIYKRHTLTPEQWARVLAVRVEGKAKDLPPMLGAWKVTDKAVRFEPRFPLVPGTSYRAVYDFNAVPETPDIRIPPLEYTITLPKPKTEPAFVEAVYPSGDVLPENTLRFYIHFSAPMSRGDVYRHIRLIREDGKVIDRAFLELDEELWGPEQKRFTLFFDPGRIKRGLKPREDLGPALEEGKKYTLEIGKWWCDAHGEPLKEAYRKAFKVVAPDDSQPDPKKWQLTAPTPGSPVLAVTLPKPLDNALLRHMVWVEDAEGRRVAGKVEVEQGETRWRFTPEKGWTAEGKYALVIDKLLEDRCGNSVARPFEVDVLRPAERVIKTETVTLPFTVRGREE